MSTQASVNRCVHANHSLLDQVVPGSVWDPLSTHNSESFSYEHGAIRISDAVKTTSSLDGLSKTPNCSNMSRVSRDGPASWCCLSLSLTSSTIMRHHLFVNGNTQMEFLSPTNDALDHYVHKANFRLCLEKVFQGDPGSTCSNKMLLAGRQRFTEACVDVAGLF